MNILKKSYEINKRRLKVILKLLKNKTGGITDPELKEANKELVMYPGWFIHDLVIVFTHLIIIILIGSPLLLVTLYERINYRSFSLSNDAYSINEDDLNSTVFLLP